MVHSPGATSAARDSPPCFDEDLVLGTYVRSRTRPWSKQRNEELARPKLRESSHTPMQPTVEAVRQEDVDVSGMVARLATPRRKRESLALEPGKDLLLTYCAFVSKGRPVNAERIEQLARPRRRGVSAHAWEVQPKLTSCTPASKVYTANSERIEELAKPRRRGVSPLARHFPVAHATCMGGFSPRSDENPCEVSGSLLPESTMFDRTVFLLPEIVNSGSADSAFECRGSDQNLQRQLPHGDFRTVECAHTGEEGDFIVGEDLPPQWPQGESDGSDGVGDLLSAEASSIKLGQPRPRHRSGEVGERHGIECCWREDPFIDGGSSLCCGGAGGRECRN